MAANFTIELLLNGVDEIIVSSSKLSSLCSMFNE